LIVRVRLPPRLEAVRRIAVEDAAHGLTAHVTLLYPFAPPSDLDREMRARIAQIVATHSRFAFRLAGPAHWPGVLYASVEPEEPIRSLQADLAAAFPELPLYGGTFDFVPHVTIAEGPIAGEIVIIKDPAWAALPAMFAARSVELISRTGGAWRTKWRFGLRRSIRVVVCGEMLRGDDGAAIRAVESLAAEVRALAEVVEVGLLSVEALLDVPEGVAVIVADAAVGIPAGQVVVVPLAEVAGRGAAGTPASSHSLPPDQVLGLAEEMRGFPLRGVFVGIGGAKFGFGERLSPAVEKGMPAFAAALADEMRRLTAG
jgi:hydrogenase maturation protease